MPTLNSIVRQVLAIDPSAPAIEYQKQWHSWGDLSAIIDAIEGILRANGIGAGTRIGGILRNSPEIAAVIIGTIIHDRCIVTLNPALPDETLAADIESLKTPVVIARSEDWQRAAVRGAVERAGALGIEITGDRADPARVVTKLSGRDFRSDAEGIGIEMLTSGTTGTPKRVPLKAGNFSKMILDAAVFEKRDVNAPPKLSKAVTISNTPFSHIGGIFGLFVSLSAGRKSCMLDRFRVEEFVDAVQRHRPKVAGAPPSALRMILDAKVPKEALSSLVAFRTSTAPLDPELADQFHKHFGIPVLQNYGATEFAGGVAGWTLPDFLKSGEQRRGSVGKMNPGVEGRIVDAESGEPLPYGEKGLLELRAHHLGDGRNWVRTTDLARMDEDQFLWILGRADNAIIRGGFKIIPDDVVKAIEAHPAVLEACVVALPDPRLGQVPAAGYRVKSGRTVSADELRAFLRERLTAYQVPTKLLEVQDFPRTPSMKPSQPELKKLLEAA
ncbi:class I adenylate-forming enzyme family protein [Sphingopyxis panaciterrulae]|uniref:Acyl-coenzyme A synthetase/AMP-(Fatty) acid ligase n=1 Tax=Sphingopyxis panaciterrulae TaxID=462372 RepID=A0A7W9EP25_9SPHN|nr:class I adenylate-forming enzyme family protein [Sphingopyxis panaciterrulae]MBB5705102.1 acyl-coenzyme A synthetase/AMP-(fatty) acid ligase [Sphingopyxis panaciterrulae]